MDAMRILLRHLPFRLALSLEVDAITMLLTRTLLAVSGAITGEGARTRRTGNQNIYSNFLTFLLRFCTHAFARIAHFYVHSNQDPYFITTPTDIMPSWAPSANRHGSDLSRIEAPVTLRGYLLCVFA